MQQVFYTHIVKAIRPDSLDVLFTRRLAKMLPDRLADIDLIDWERFRSVMRRCNPYPAMAVVKTIANSWCTSYRYHETPRLTCLFGCAARDDQVHYIQCTQLWQAVRAATGTPDTQDPLVKLVVGQPSEKRVGNPAVAFYVPCG